jgi:hypothetical protein
VWHASGGLWLSFVAIISLRVLNQRLGIVFGMPCRNGAQGALVRCGHGVAGQGEVYPAILRREIASMTPTTYGKTCAGSAPPPTP